MQSGRFTAPLSNLSRIDSTPLPYFHERRNASMKLKFSREVRMSAATEIKKVSTYGGIGIGILGYSANSPIALFASFVWWLVCQLLAHVLMSIED